MPRRVVVNHCNEFSSTVSHPVTREVVLERVAYMSLNVPSIKTQGLRKMFHIYFYAEPL